MRSLLAASALALGVSVPGLAAAQDLSVSAGFTLTSRYVSSGIEQTKGAAFQPWVEAEIAGFYFGAWASNTTKSVIGHSAEIDLYLGYRNQIGIFAYDVGYARYFYRGPSWDCCGEITLDLSVTPVEQFTVGLDIAHDPSADVTNSAVYASFAPMDKITLDATYGEINKGGHSYWSVGAGYAVTDSLGLSLAYHDTDISKGLAVLSLDYSFSIR